MLFHTIEFLLFFIFAFLIYSISKIKKIDVPVLLILSNLFYAYWDWRFLGLLWFTIIVDFLIARTIYTTDSEKKKKLLLLISLISNFGVLAVFKYFNFFISSLNQIGIDISENLLIINVIVPVGLSFYIFQSIGYTLDVYKNKQVPVKNLINYATFVSYFPQLIAGPIEKVNKLLPQIITPSIITPKIVLSGILLFSFGLFRKALADSIGEVIDPIFSNIDSTTGDILLLAIFGYGLQIYLDFTGYVDMARGISRIMGIELSLNFNAPYLSTSIREFWRRWHITLSQWLRDNLYIPLGGSKNGVYMHVFALITTMTLGGLWHGAGLNFIIWGVLHGLYLIINIPLSVMKLYLYNYFISKNINKSIVNIFFILLGWVVTILAVNYAWLYFRINNMSDIVLVHEKIFTWIINPSMNWQLNIQWLLILFVIICMDFIIRFKPILIAYNFNYDSTNESKIAIFTKSLLSIVFLILGIILLAGQTVEQFIYFQF